MSNDSENVALEPRHYLQDTEANGKLEKLFWLKYSVWRRNSNMLPHNAGIAADLFTSDTLTQLQAQLGSAALDVPVVVTDDVADETIAAFRYWPDGSEPPYIAVNARMLVDPAILAHALIEEFAHAKQYFDNVDFAAEKARYSYADRPHEIEAKAIADAILGYARPRCKGYITRPMPPISEFYGDESAAEIN